MRYIFLIYAGEDDSPVEALPEFAKDYAGFDAEIRAAGVLIAREFLQPALTATTLRAPLGKPSLTDGPAAQTPLALSGYYALNVADERDALRWASKLPGARIGAVEIRRAMSQP